MDERVYHVLGQDEDMGQIARTRMETKMRISRNVLAKKSIQ
jgi:hypothetical protein